MSLFRTGRPVSPKRARHWRTGGGSPALSRQGGPYRLSRERRAESCARPMRNASSARPLPNRSLNRFRGPRMARDHMQNLFSFLNHKTVFCQVRRPLASGEAYRPRRVHSGFSRPFCRFMSSALRIAAKRAPKGLLTRPEGMRPGPSGRRVLASVPFRTPLPQACAAGTPPWARHKKRRPRASRDGAGQKARSPAVSRKRAHPVRLGTPRHADAMPRRPSSPDTRLRGRVPA